MAQILRCGCLISCKRTNFISLHEGLGYLPDPFIFCRCAKNEKNVPTGCDGQIPGVNGL